MTKGELLKFLEPYDDSTKISIFVRYKDSMGNTIANYTPDFELAAGRSFALDPLFINCEIVIKVDAPEEES